MTYLDVLNNLKIIQQNINKLVEEKGIFVLGNPFTMTLLNHTIEELEKIIKTETDEM